MFCGEVTLYEGMMIYRPVIAVADLIGLCVLGRGVLYVTVDSKFCWTGSIERSSEMNCQLTVLVDFVTEPRLFHQASTLPKLVALKN